MKIVVTFVNKKTGEIKQEVKNLNNKEEVTDFWKSMQMKNFAGSANDPSDPTHWYAQVGEKDGNIVSIVVLETSL